MAMDAQRKVALITGAGQRIGAAIASQLHQAGYDVALHYRQSLEASQALAARFELARPGSSVLLAAELARLDQVQALVHDTLQHFGRLDVLVNNASSFFPTALGTATEQQWDELFASNAKAPLFLSQAAAPALRASGGSIVNLTDIYAERGLAQHPIYVMAKAALVAMTRTLALDLAPEVRINALAPGAILWPQQATNQAAQQAIVARTPLARTGTAEEIAEAVLWLARDARYVTGQIIHLDGGRSISL